MKGKICALIRQTWYEAAIKNLSDAERLMFYEACFKFEFTGEEPTRKTCPYATVLLMFDMVKVELIADAEKAQRIAERNRANGALGGRPVTSNEMLQDITNPQKPIETQEKALGYFGSPEHNNIKQHIAQQQQQYTAQQQQSAAAGVFDGEFFEVSIWPKLDPENKYRTRHRACLAMWLEFSQVKRACIVREVQADLFLGGVNPYFYLQDFAEPSPKWLEGKAVEDEWKAGRSVYQVKDGEKYRLVSGDDLQLFGLTPTKELKPQ